MNIYLNGKAFDCKASNLAQLHSELDLPPMVAIALENKVIPKAEWEHTPLTEEAHLVIIRMACGG